MSTLITRYHAKGGELRRLGSGAIAPPVTGGTDPNAARFPGDPGRGVQYSGCNNAGPNTGTPIATLDEQVFNGMGGAFMNDRHFLAREYSTGFFMSDADKRNLSLWGDQGRITLYSIQSGDFAHKVVAEEKDDQIAEFLEFFKALGVPIGFTLNHEAETKTGDATDRFWHRAAARRFRDISDDIGATNVIHIASYMVSDTFRNKDYKQWHMDYVDDNEWVEKAHMDGWDPYVPRLQADRPFSETPEARIKNWQHYHDEWWNAVGENTQYGARRLPMALGETGVYSDSSLYGTGAGATSPGEFFKQIAADEWVPFNCLWASSNCKFNAEKDPTGWRLQGFQDYYRIPNVKRIVRA